MERAMNPWMLYALALGLAISGMVIGVKLFFPAW